MVVLMFQIKNIEFFVRETKPARFPSALGKAGQSGKKPEHVTSPLCHVRMVIKDSEGNESFGCSADRLSVRWLDKRPGRTKAGKLRSLVELIEFARDMYLATPRFESPFQKWLACHPLIMMAGQRRDEEDLTSTYVSSLLERAMIDGVCRLAGRPLFEMLRDDRLGFRPADVHPKLKGFKILSILRRRPNTRIGIRHTVGIFDPLTSDDWPREKRLNDGLPETVQDYIRQEGIRYFKVKISGDAAKDFDRLKRLWSILPYEREPVVTLDANEAFEDLEAFAQFVERLERDQLGLFQHIAFIEQPLPRRLTFDKKAERWIRRVGRLKPVIIDEADDTLTSFKRAKAMGYAGTSHKNCKGVFKSLMSKALISHLAHDSDDILVQSAEDLQNLPIVPLHQDFVSVGILDLQHCERNGHHYNFGLSMLSEKDRASVVKHHKDLYEKRDGEWFLKIRDGLVHCTSLHCPGFGVRDEPDWPSMEPLNKWLGRRGRAADSSRRTGRLQ